MIAVREGFMEVSSDYPGSIPTEVNVKDTTVGDPMEIVLELKKENEGK
jgi:hypothetical protein